MPKEALVVVLKATSTCRESGLGERTSDRLQ